MTPEEKKDKLKIYNKNRYESKKDEILSANKAWRNANKEKVKAIKKAWLITNRDKYLDGKKTYRLNNKDKVSIYNKAYHTKRRTEDSFFKLKHNTRCVITESFKRTLNGTYKKGKKTEEILGCSMDYFINVHIESLLEPWMTFDNHGEWHIDHIIPLATAKTEEDVIRLNHYTNLQPLWAKENLSKGGRILQSI